MANTTVNKVVLGNETLLDLTGDTVTANTLMLGYTAHDASGAQITGTADGGAAEGNVWQDQDGYLVVSDASGISYQSKSKTYTPTESQQSETISPDSGYGGLSSVNVTVGAISSSYVGSGVARKSSSDLTASGATVTTPAGYYASSASKSVQNGSLVATETYSVTPAITVSNSGLVTASIEQSGNASPVYTSGWIDSSAAQYVTVSAYNTQQLPAASQFAGINSSFVTESNVRKWRVTASTIVDPEEGGSAGWLSEGVYSGVSLGYNAVPANTTVTPTTSSQTIGGANYMMEGPVTVAAMPSGTAGTPTATKGTVSNHSVSVTPSVTNSSGYISGGTKTGTAVTVTASELASGNLAITENTASTSCVGYSTVSVDVPTGGNTVTLSGTGHASRVYVQLNHTGTKYYAAGDTIPFSDGDELYVYAIGSLGGGTISVNGETVATSPYGAVSYTLELPACDVAVTLNYSTASTIAVTIPTKSITTNGTHDVSGYGYANVAVTQTSGMSEADLKNFIERSSNFTDIDWPSGLTKIGTYAFANLSYFDPASLPSTVTAIDGYAFYNCTRLALASLPSGITNIRTYAFYGCTNLALTSLPSGVTSISTYAFYQCQKLALTSLPSGVTGSISSYAFYGCSMLALTSLPSGVTSISGYAFYGCSMLALTSLPSGVTSISSYAFYGCTGIASISCLGPITTMATNAFTGSSSAQMQLASASFPNMALTSNLSYAFGNTTAANACQLLAFCDIGSTVGIAANAFANCYALETLVLRKTASVCALANVSAFTNTPMSGYGGKTGTVYVPQALISSYQTATNWSTLYNNGTVTFSAIEGSDYELD